jgi:hypothetical protein
MTPARHAAARARNAGFGVLAIALVAAGWWGIRRGSPRDDGAPSGANAAPDSTASLGPFEAYQRALALGGHLHFIESLPYFERALSEPPDAWQPYAAYATSLFQTTHQVRPHRGRVEPVTRSSFERVRLLGQARAELGQAEQRARNSKDRAYVISLGVKHLLAWGLAWDAYSEDTRAEKLDPSLAHGKANRRAPPNPETGRDE